MEFSQYDFNKKFEEFLNKNYDREFQDSQKDAFNDFYTIWTEKIFKEPNQSDEQEEKDPDVGVIITKGNEEMIIHVKVLGFNKEDFNIFIEDNELIIQTNNSFDIQKFNDDKVISDFKIEKISKKITLNKEFINGEVKAYLENGILRISIKKSKEFTRNIKII